MPRPPSVSSHALTLQMQSLGVASAQQLADGLGVDRSTVSRGLAALGDAVLRVGAARSARYALRRDVRNLGRRWSLQRIDARGRAHHLGNLHAVHGGYYWQPRGVVPQWLRHGYANGFFPGLPFFLSDMRPQGFLGRALAREWGPLNGLPADLQQWQDDDALVAMLVFGDDLPGDLFVGTRAVGVALQSPRREVVAVADRSQRYPEMADLAMQSGAVGSSAGGEQPKFTAAVRETDGGMRSVLVKFSPPMDTPSGRRWADLLAAEWLALRVLAEHGHESAAAELIEGGGRRFLEVTRFDRVGDAGRRGVLTLQAIEAGLVNEHAADWPAVANAMERMRLMTEADARALCRRWCFGELTANTDMHLANASVWFGDVEPLALAPAYDMLPMLFRPGAGGEIVSRQFNAALPQPHLREEWDEVRPWALEFWRRLMADERISPEFRAIGQRAGETVARFVAD